ncbi:MAG: glycosyltransferase [Clostridia bacterium]|nr:glycosyltransferase [Clostridia bacterium]
MKKSCLKIVQINSCTFGSTGKIMRQIADNATACGYDVYCCYPKSRENLKIEVRNSIIIGGRISRNLHLLLSEFTGFNGCFSVLATASFLRKLKKIEPDIIHLHNLHNCYINLPMLFNYIKKHNIPVVWTLHDCWSFTGQCPYFTLEKCDKWETGCFGCPQYRRYPSSRVDRTKTMYRYKRSWFTGVQNMTLVTPSEWLADLVHQSFLKEYETRVINNGIDLCAFNPIKSDFREKNGISKGQFILLGVSFGWGVRKGLDVFIELSKRLDRSRFKIVLVGTDDEVDKTLPDTVLSIHRTNNQKELAQIYSAADLFVNPTREEVLGMVNIEALACGTPVLTFRTGGSPESLNETCGSVVDCDDIDAMEQEIYRIASAKPFYAEDCLIRAKDFDMNKRFDEYIQLYKEIL